MSDDTLSESIESLKGYLTEEDLDELMQLFSDYQPKALPQDEIDRMLEEMRKEVERQEARKPRKSKTLCDCGILFVYKDAKPHQHSTWCFLFKEQK